MYAYVKLLKGGKCTTVGIKQIKNYKKKPNKIFDVKIKGEYEKCLIGAVRDTKEELDELIDNGERIRFPSAAVLSEASETENQTTSQGASLSVVNDNTRDILNKKLLALDKEKKKSSTVGDSDLEEDTIASNDEDDSEQESDDESTSDETPPYTEVETVKETKVSSDEKEETKKKNEKVLNEMAEEEKEDVSAPVIPSNNKEDKEKISFSDEEN